MTGSSSESEQKSKSKTFQFDFTPFEDLAAEINFEALGAQLDAILAQADFQKEVFGVAGPALQQLFSQQQVESDVLTPEFMEEKYREEIARGETKAAAGDEVLQMQLDRLRAGYQDVPTWSGTTDLTPEQRELIDQNTMYQLQMGQSNIDKYGQDVLNMITEELAPARGLRPTDTPIQDRAFRVGEEMVRQQGMLQGGLSAQAAQQMLQYPLQTAQLGQAGAQINQNAWNLGNQMFNNNAQFQQQLSQSAGDFLKNLQQQNFNQKLALAGQAGQLGLGAAQLGPNAAFQQALKPQLGTKQKSSGSTESSGGGISDFFKKTDHEAIDHQAVLEAFDGLPVERWKYMPGVEDGGSQPHIGTYAQDFRDAFGLGDGETISYTDAIGVLMGAVKALKARVEELEGRRDG